MGHRSSLHKFPCPVLDKQPKSSSSSPVSSPSAWLSSFPDQSCLLCCHSDQCHFPSDQCHFHSAQSHLDQFPLDTSTPTEDTPTTTELPTSNDSSQMTDSATV